jgi:hypothetical protein
METKKYYCSSNSKSYTINVVFTIVSAFVAAFCLIMLISPIVLFWVWDWLNLDLDTPVLYAIVLFLAFWSIWSAVMYRKTWKNMSNNPVLEIGDDSITVTNMANGVSNVIKYKEIDRVEVSQINLMGKKISCINVIPTADAYSKMISRYKKTDRNRIEGIYKRTGAIEQIYENLLDKTVVGVCEDIQENLNEYRKRQ